MWKRVFWNTVHGVGFGFHFFSVWSMTFGVSVGSSLRFRIQSSQLHCENDHHLSKFDLSRLPFQFGASFEVNARRRWPAGYCLCSYSGQRTGQQATHCVIHSSNCQRVRTAPFARSWAGRGPPGGAGRAGRCVSPEVMRRINETLGLLRSERTICMCQACGRHQGRL